MTTPEARPGFFARVRIRAEVLWTWGVARRRQRSEDIRTTVASLRSPRWSKPARPFTAARGAILAELVDQTLTPLPLDSRCLVQSLVVTGLIARRGGTSRLVIGVRPGEEFGAHAWVEVDGQPVMPGAGDYPRLTEL